MRTERGEDEKKKKELKAHLHYKSPPDDVVQGSVIKSIFGLVVEIVFVRTDGLQQLQYVVGVQSAGLCCHAARQVSVANVRHTLNSTKDIKTIK